MGDEFKAFPYLNHKIPEAQKAVYVEAAKPLDFKGLYSPRQVFKLILLLPNYKLYYNYYFLLFFNYRFQSLI